MGKGKLVFKSIVQDAAVRVVEADCPAGRVWKCDIHWPRGRSRKRKVHNLGLASTLTKSMAINLIVPLIEKMKAEYGKTKAPLLSAMITKFLTLHGATVKPKTAKWYREGLKKVLKGIGDRPLTAITPALLEEYKSSNTRTPGFTNNSLHVLHTLFEKAILWDYVEQNPVRRVPFLKPNPSRARMFTDDERQKLLRSAQIDPYPGIYKFLLWMLNTGMRPGEVVRIKESDVDLKEGRVRLGVTKSNRPRYVPLNKAALETAWSLWHGDGGTLFRGWNGQPLKVITAQRVFHRVAVRAGINVRPYDCRHDCLSRLAADGASLPTLQAVAGHSTLAMGSRYMHLSPNHFDQVKEAVDRVAISGIRDNVVTTATSEDTVPPPQVHDNEGDLVTAGTGDRFIVKSTG